MDDEIRDADEILDDLRESGTMPTAAEVEQLCVMALQAETAAATIDEIERKLRRAGWAIVDMTTDDDELPVVKLVAPQTAKDSS